jgi:D-3-phosphoglycerate dehydrogenase
MIFHMGPLANEKVFSETIAKESGLTIQGVAHDDPPERMKPVLDEGLVYQVQSGGGQAITQTGHNGGAAFLARCPKLLAISMPGAGHDGIDVKACTEAGVLVISQAGLNKDAVAQTALAMILSLCRKMIQAHNALRGEGVDDRWNYAGNIMNGRTLGIFGFGHIGQHLANICRAAFDMRILTPHPRKSADEVSMLGAELVSLEEMLSQSDFVVCTAPLNDETENVFDARAFARMKPSAYFITVGRGGIHDEDALAVALRDGEIQGAGLDVWKMEPPAQDHPLMNLPNVYVNPHVGGISDEGTAMLNIEAVRQIIATVSGARPPRLVNGAAWPLYCKRFETIMGFPAAKSA